jgi:hypothetical protein
VLDDIAFLLQRVDVVAEREQHAHVHGVAHQVGLRVDRRGGGRGPQPAPAQPPGDLGQAREVRADLRRVERRDPQAAQPAPARALGREQAVHAELVGDGLDVGDAAEGLGTLAQHVLRERGIGGDDGAARAEADRVQGPEPRGPAFQHRVQPRAGQLQRVAEHGQAVRTRQVVQGAQRSAFRHVSLLLWSASYAHN